MELKFEKKECPCLRWVTYEVQTQEQTQEVKLGDSMPDVGRVLACWGQPILRSKEWHGNGMNAGGGVMTWTLYAPEDGTEPRCIESWIPFQMKWSFPQTQREGIMAVKCVLLSADARSVSARKLMVRVCVSAQGEAVEPWNAEVYSAGELPEDIQILENMYPMELPVEAGEKAFIIDEDISWDGDASSLRLIHYEFHPEVQEQRVIEDRMVFRGEGRLHMLYRTEDGQMRSRDFDVPFSQYVELDKEYGHDTGAHIAMVVTSLELEPEVGRLRLKAGMAAQYVIHDRYMARITEDAYSTGRSVSVQEEALTLPAVLESRHENVRIQHTIPGQPENIVECWYLPDYPTYRQNGDELDVELPGVFNVLYTDENGSLTSSSSRSIQQMKMKVDRDAAVQLGLGPVVHPQAAIVDGIQMMADYPLKARTISGRAMPMVTALEAGEQEEPDPMRPSLILRRVNEKGLWNLAKDSGSTVEAIRQANRLTNEPEVGQLLLIPVP